MLQLRSKFHRESRPGSAAPERQRPLHPRPHRAEAESAVSRQRCNPWTGSAAASLLRVLLPVRDERGAPLLFSRQQQRVNFPRQCPVVRSSCQTFYSAEYGPLSLRQLLLTATQPPVSSGSCSRSVTRGWPRKRNVKLRKIAAIDTKALHAAACAGGDSSGSGPGSGISKVRQQCGKVWDAVFYYWNKFEKFFPTQSRPWFSSARVPFAQYLEKSLRAFGNFRIASKKNNTLIYLKSYRCHQDMSRSIIPLFAHKISWFF